MAYLLHLTVMAAVDAVCGKIMQSVENISVVMSSRCDGRGLVIQAVQS
jgi:hypothetical protein